MPADSEIVSAMDADGALLSEVVRKAVSLTGRTDLRFVVNEPVRKHYAKWSPARQSRIDDLMQRVHSGTDWAVEHTPLIN
jgi:hypothetical protein